jgi:hypothetical protein
MRTHDPSNQAAKTYALDRAVTGTSLVSYNILTFSKVPQKESTVVVDTSASYSEGPRFKSRPGYWLS